MYLYNLLSVVIFVLVVFLLREKSKIPQWRHRWFVWSQDRTLEHSDFSFWNPSRCNVIRGCLVTVAWANKKFGYGFGHFNCVHKHEQCACNMLYMNRQLSFSSDAGIRKCGTLEPVIPVMLRHPRGLRCIEWREQISITVELVILAQPQSHECRPGQ